MYPIALAVHSWLRWPVLAAGLWLLVVAFTGWRSGAPWSPSRARLRDVFARTMGVQVLLGLALYLIWSPVPSAAWSDIGAAMKDPVLRFFGVEHIFAMLVAMVTVEVMGARAKRCQSAADTHRLIFIAQCVWLVLVLAAIPWPALDVGRPLFRF
jgi:hypothetical protein